VTGRLYCNIVHKKQKMDRFIDCFSKVPELNVYHTQIIANSHNRPLRHVILRLRILYIHPDTEGGSIVSGPFLRQDGIIHLYAWFQHVAKMLFLAHQLLLHEKRKYRTDSRAVTASERR
jgi:hypothetical protein